MMTGSIVLHAGIIRRQTMVSIGHNQARRAAATARPTIKSVPALLVALALLHGLLYVWLVPPWQAPDEPAQFEYAALIAALGRTPTVGDKDAALAALPLRMLAARPIETQLLALRLLGVLLTACAVLCTYGAARELLPAACFAPAAGLIAALRPMFVFVGAGAGNDS